MRRLTPILPILWLVCLCGCNISLPRLFQPGHGKEQQLRATFHDPYGDVNLGPEIAGGRPIDYQRPRTAPVNAQWFLGR